jgi:DNA repair protein RadC
VRKESNLKTPHYWEHRDRLRQRFDTDARVTTYELLELLLFLARPRCDTKPVAKALLETFRSLNGVLAAPKDRLKEVSGVGNMSVHVLKLVLAIVNSVLSERIVKRPVFTVWQHVIEYLQTNMGYLAEEHFRILFLDNKNQLIANELQQKGTINQSPLYPREVMRRALELGAAAIILVHNHPSGDPTPSQEDVRATRAIQDLGGKLGVAVHDHIVIGKHTHRSMRSMGLI